MKARSGCYASSHVSERNYGFALDNGAMLVILKLEVTALRAQSYTDSMNKTPEYPRRKNLII
jgi:hypothetical protein